jgi:tetratricopeptide (TPR) repeat protein
VEEGDLYDALNSFRDSLVIRERLAKADPGNVSGQRDLAFIQERIGHVLWMRNELDDALKSFRDGFATRERLAKIDPSNARWRRDLSISYTRVGDVLAAQNDLQGALKNFRDGLAIAERLAETDPENVQWQADVLWLNWRLAKYGDDPARRWALIVVTLRKLNGKLNAEQTTWLPVAEAELAKFQETNAEQQ